MYSPRSEVGACEAPGVALGLLQECRIKGPRPGEHASYAWPNLDQNVCWQTKSEPRFWYARIGGYHFHVVLADRLCDAFQRIELQVALLTELLPSKARASKGSSRHEGNGSGMVQLQVPEGPASGNQEIRSADLEPDILSSVALARCLCFLGGNGGRLCDTGRLRGGPVTTPEAEVCRGNRGHC